MVYRYGNQISILARSIISTDTNSNDISIEKQSPKLKFLFVQTFTLLWSPIPDHFKRSHHLSFNSRLAMHTCYALSYSLNRPGYSLTAYILEPMTGIMADIAGSSTASQTLFPQCDCASLTDDILYVLKILLSFCHCSVLVTAQKFELKMHN